MSKDKRTEAEKIAGQLFGNHLHQIVTGKVDEEAKSKRPEDQVRVPFKFATTKAILVKGLEINQLAGGVPAIFINGGKSEGNPKGITIGVSSRNFIKSANDFRGNEDITEEDLIFVSAKAACEIANATNIAERDRLRTMIASLKAQEASLTEIIEANISGMKQFESEED